MRKLAILVLLAGTVSTVFAAKRLTVDQVNQLLMQAHGRPDGKLADQLFDMELTERVSSARLASWEAELPGPKSRQALIALADTAMFLRLPPDEVPGTPAPDRAAQESLLALARNYVTDTIPKLPNFFATRTTTRFSDEPVKINSMTMVNSQYQQMHFVETTSDKAYFREGKEVIVNNKNKEVSFTGNALTTQGVFGEAMELVLADVLPSDPAWSHWEGGTEAPLAVFHYAVPLKKSHYAVRDTDDPGSTSINVAYQGEIAVDSADGSIRRLTAVAELRGSSPISKADVMVKYEPVAIGGTNYICPVESVSLAVMRGVEAASNSQTNATAMPNARNANTGPDYQNGFSAAGTPGRRQLTKVNDVQFTEYHRFRAETRILTGDDAGPESTPPAPAPALNATPNP